MSEPPDQHLVTVGTPIAMIPAKYREAVQALQECTTLKETRYWSNLADALKAYSKMYTDDDAMKAARRLKLHAYRRMSAIAKQIAEEEEKTVAQVMKAAKAKTMTVVSAYPIQGSKPKKDRRLRTSAATVLARQGLKVNQVNEITRIGSISESRFQEMVDVNKHPPAIHKAAYEGMKRVTARLRDDDTYIPLMGRAQNTSGGNLAAFVVFTQRYKPEKVRALAPDEVAQVRTHLIAVQEWCDAVERFLPKAAPKTTPTANKHK